MKDNSFKVIDENGLEKVFKIICLINNEKNNKQYLVYDDNKKINASAFVIENDKYILSPITNEELEFVNIELNKKIEEAFEGE